MKKEYDVVQFNSADELFDYSYLCYSDEIWESYAKEEVKDIIEEYRLTESVGPFFVNLVDGHFDIDEFTICRDYEIACRLKKQLVSNY